MITNAFKIVLENNASAFNSVRPPVSSFASTCERVAFMLQTSGWVLYLFFKKYWFCAPCLSFLLYCSARYRLCKAEAELTEACFQATPVPFAGDSMMMMSNGTMLQLNSTFVYVRVCLFREGARVMISAIFVLISEKNCPKKRCLHVRMQVLSNSS